MPDTLVLLLAVAYPVAVLVLVRRVRWPGRGSSQGSWFGGRWERRWVRGVDCACVLLIGFSSAYRANSGGCLALSANLPQLPNKPLPILASRAPNGEKPPCNTRTRVPLDHREAAARFRLLADI